MDYRMPVILNQFRFKVNGRRKICRIADDTDKILYHIRRCFLRYTDHRTVIQHTHKYVSAKSIQKGADGLINIMFNPVAAALKFHCNGFSDRKRFFECLYIHPPAPFLLPTIVLSF